MRHFLLIYSCRGPCLFKIRVEDRTSRQPFNTFYQGRRYWIKVLMNLACGESRSRSSLQGFASISRIHAKIPHNCKIGGRQLSPYKQSSCSHERALLGSLLRFTRRFGVQKIIGKGERSHLGENASNYRRAIKSSRIVPRRSSQFPFLEVCPQRQSPRSSIPRPGCLRR